MRIFKEFNDWKEDSQPHFGSASKRQLRIYISSGKDSNIT